MFKLPFNGLFSPSNFLEENRDGNSRVITHSEAGSIIYTKSPRSRNIRISVRTGSEVRVTLPQRCSYGEADRFVLSKIEWIIKTQAKLQARKPLWASTPAAADALRRQAQTALPARTAHLAARHGFEYAGAAVKDMRSRWGSCSADNRLNLSIYLAALPPDLADYVILHELCHTIHKNHGPQFWHLLNQVTQGCAKSMAKQLKQYAV